MATIFIKNKRTYKPKGDEEFITKGTILGTIFRDTEDTKDLSVSCFGDYLHTAYRTNAMVKWVIDDLSHDYTDGKDITLVCDCESPPCHGEVIADWIKFIALFGKAPI